MKKDTNHRSDGWYGFDLDGTLAEFDGWKGIGHIGRPVARMVELAKRLHSEGKEVRILTARASVKNDEGKKGAAVAKAVIKDWCRKNLGFEPEVTSEKDARMIEFYDDSATQVVPNRGETLEDLSRKGNRKAIARYLAIIDRKKGR